MSPPSVHFGHVKPPGKGFLSSSQTVTTGGTARQADLTMNFNFEVDSQPRTPSELVRALRDAIPNLHPPRLRDEKSRKRVSLSNGKDEHGR